MAIQEQDLWRMDAYTLATGRRAGGRLQVSQFAGAGSRIAAGLIDFLLQGISGITLYYLLCHLRPDLLAQAASNLYFLAAAAALEWHLIYSLLFEAFSRGTSPGKAMCGIRVVRRSDLGTPTALQILVRNLMRVIDILPFAYLGGLLSIVFSPRSQRLGDMLAGSIVVYRRTLPEQLAAANVPDSIFSSSEDGYLLQAFMARAPHLRQETRSLLAQDLARYLVMKYAGSEESIRQVFNAGNYEACLQLLYEREAAS